MSYSQQEAEFDVMEERRVDCKKFHDDFKIGKTDICEECLGLERCFSPCEAIDCDGCEGVFQCPNS